jgi:nitrogen fixation-related uncharacterized protein
MICVFYFYFYQILTTFNELKIMSEVAHDNWKRFHKIVFHIGDTTLNVSTEQLFYTGIYTYLWAGKNNNVEIYIYLWARKNNNVEIYIYLWAGKNNNVEIYIYLWAGKNNNVGIYIYLWAGKNNNVGI